MGAGVLHVVTEGLTSFPNLAQTQELWTEIVDAGVGARIGVRGRLELALEVHAQAARNYPVIRFTNSVVARSGRPTMIASLTLLAWL